MDIIKSISKYGVCFMVAVMPLQALCATIQIETGNPKKVSPVKYGFHYEEIGMIGEGGLHAELIRNRSFEEANPPKGHTVVDGLYQNVPNPKGNNKTVMNIDPLIGWSSSGKGIAISRTDANPLNDANAHSLLAEVVSPEGAWVENGGFYGMNIVEGNDYYLSFYVLADKFDGSLGFVLCDRNGNPISEEVQVEIGKRSWKKLSARLTATGNDTRGKLRIIPHGRGNFQLDVVSMFPGDTWNDGKSIFRKDIMQNLVEYSPEFLRFPGGCIVHGTNPQTCYHWKETIGDIASRPGAWSKWAPFYRTDGLGYHEFYELCEYLGADAMYVTPTGMICTEWVFRKDKNSLEFNHPETDIDYYVDDVLDAIEYAIGGIETKWGAQRARNGHPQPFPLKYVEIGNEDFGPMYHERYDAISRAVSSRYPQIRIIANSPIAIQGCDINPDDKREFLRQFPDPGAVGIYDEHYYKDLPWVVANYYKFDRYERPGPDLFIGELGISGYPDGTLAEGVVKLALERNGDLNPLMADRPLMRNRDFTNGSMPSALMQHTSSQSIKGFNFHLCKMFRDNKIDIYYPTKCTENDGKESGTLFAGYGFDSSSDEYVLKIINLSDNVQATKIDGLDGKFDCITTVLSADFTDKKFPDDPAAISPDRSEGTIDFSKDMTIAPRSFTVIRFRK